MSEPGRESVNGRRRASQGRNTSGGGGERAREGVSQGKVSSEAERE